MSVVAAGDCGGGGGCGGTCAIFLPFSDACELLLRFIFACFSRLQKGTLKNVARPLLPCLPDSAYDGKDFLCVLLGHIVCREERGRKVCSFGTIAPLCAFGYIKSPCYLNVLKVFIAILHSIIESSRIL